MVITDYNMPEMDGFELTVKLRQKFGKDRLSIIGISGAEDDYFTAKFIKLGANDFLKKPFGTEEFYCRVTQNLELLGMIQHIKEASNTDYLTKLFNRRYFFDSGTRAFLRAIQDGVPMALAMLDIDFFKRINDTFGHEGGDEALKTVAQLLKDQSRPSDFVARFGGEEFCMLLVGIEPTDAFAKMEHLRKSIGAIRIPFEEKVIQFTVSMGLVTDKGMSLPKMINLADRRLYLAKSEGRNRLIAEGE
jgi:diguanylate cyclase (GGDEF)-like protein